MRWCHTDFQFYAKFRIPVLLTLKSLANLALVLMSSGSDLAI